jgi:RimJ/RimL family protein N-acetyltransferase
MPRVKLRNDVALVPLGLDHAANMLAWVQDPEISSNLGLTAVPSIEKTRDWIQSALGGKSLQPSAILHRSQHVGNVVLDLYDPHLESARLSIYVGVGAARGCGVGTTAIYYALRAAFVDRGLHKVWLTVHARNAGAIRTYSLLGFQVEGVLRDGFRLNGQWVSALYMGLLGDEFLQLETEMA